MSIHRLTIRNLRNISSSDLEFSPAINLITGNNGSGKSTLLEALYLIGRGQSYRTKRFGSVIQKGQRSTILFAEAHSDRKYNIGIEKTAQSTKVKVNGGEIKRLSEIARITPVQIITPMSHAILERGPELRRRFIEWGVFHVEHDYFLAYREYSKALKQRNHALRQNREFEHWDSILIRYAERLNNLRINYFNKLKTHFERQVKKLGFDQIIEIAWKQGWPDSMTFSEALRQSVLNDRQRGFTQYGPQRADIGLKFDQRSALNTLSRGQQKMLITALHLAQADVMRERRGYEPIILIDDLVSELDRENRRVLIEQILQRDTQVFITATETDILTKPTEAERFEIDSGVITRSRTEQV